MLHSMRARRGLRVAMDVCSMVLHQLRQVGPAAGARGVCRVIRRPRDS